MHIRYAYWHRSNALSCTYYNKHSLFHLLWSSQSKWRWLSQLSSARKILIRVRVSNTVVHLLCDFQPHLQSRHARLKICWCGYAWVRITNHNGCFVELLEVKFVCALLWDIFGVLRWHWHCNCCCRCCSSCCYCWCFYGCCCCCVWWIVVASKGISFAAPLMFSDPNLAVAWACCCSKQIVEPA